MDINQFFPQKVCINLDRRPERWERMRERFREHGIRDVERFAAFDGRQWANPPGWSGPPAAYACTKSHVEVVRRARDAGLPRLMVFEDDVLFDPRFGDRFGERIAHLPEDWDMLFLGSLLQRDPEMVGPGIGRVRKAHSTFAYALRHTVYDAFIEINETSPQPVDNNNTVLQERFDCYAFYPFLAWVESGFSDVEGAEVDHWQIRESLVLQSAETDRVLAKTGVIARLVDARHAEFLVETIRTLHASARLVLLVDEASDFECADERVEILSGDVLSAARKLRGAGCETFYVTDSDIHLRRPDLKACLRMAQSRAFVRPFSKLVELDGEGRRRLREGSLRWIDASAGREATPPDDVWILSARSVDALAEWPPPPSVLELSDVFASPATAARV